MDGLITDHYTDSYSDGLMQFYTSALHTFVEEHWSNLFIPYLN